MACVLFYPSFQNSKDESSMMATNQDGKCSKPYGASAQSGDPSVQFNPYRDLFQPIRWQEVAQLFAGECCALLGLSNDSPLYIW